MKVTMKVKMILILSSLTRTRKQMRRGRMISRRRRHTARTTRCSSSSRTFKRKDGCRSQQGDRSKSRRRRQHTSKVTTTTIFGTISTSLIETNMWKRHHHSTSATLRSILATPRQISFKSKELLGSASISQEALVLKESIASSITECHRKKTWREPTKTI